MAPSSAPTCAAITLRPLSKLLAGRTDVPNDMRSLLALSADPTCRIPVSTVLGLIDQATTLTGESDLGLQAAMFTEVGDFSVLEWVATSASTWRESNEIVCRYARVLNEAARYRIQVCGDKAHLILGSSMRMSRPAVDFQLAAHHLAIRLRIPESPPELEVWMRHTQPTEISGYRAVFPTAKLVFGAAFDGFVSDAARLESPLPTANGPLHNVLRDYAERLLLELSPEDEIVDRVVADIRANLHSGRVNAERTAARCGMSRRTLTRRLADRGTGYAALLTEVRHQSAVHYLEHTKQSVEDIAFILGYSECPPFIRAFRRWTGLAPLDHRRGVKPAV